MSRLKHIANENGNLAVDFLFAITIVFASMAVFFSLTFSLSVIEISQYIGFASARTYHAAHLDKQTQTQRANKKFANLVSVQPFKSLFKSSGWFELSNKGKGPGDYSDEFQATSPRDIFVGVQLNFKALMLDMNIPIVGNTSNQGGFESNINAFLGREPSFTECMDNFVLQKASLIESLGYTLPGGVNSLKAMVDNGC